MVDKKLSEVETDVQMPQPDFVYYDSVLETVMQVHEVGDEFVTYVVEGDVDNVHSDPIERFLAWLAADRFIKLGIRGPQSTIESTQDDLSHVFEHRYRTVPETVDEVEMAARVLQHELGTAITPP